MSQWMRAKNFPRWYEKSHNAGREIRLTDKEVGLLELLMRRPGRVFSRSEILDSVWGNDKDPLTNVVDVYIRHLRAKIDHGEKLWLIGTVRGRG